MEQDGLQWSSMIYSEAEWFAAEQDGLSRSRMVYSGAGWLSELVDD